MDSARRDACHGDRDGRAPQSAIRNPQSAIVDSARRTPATATGTVALPNPQSAIRNPQSWIVPGGTPATATGTVALPNPQSATRNRVTARRSLALPGWYKVNGGRARQGSGAPEEIDGRIDEQFHERRGDNAADHRRGDAFHDVGSGAVAPEDGRKAGDNHARGHGLGADALDRAVIDGVTQVGDIAHLALLDPLLVGEVEIEQHDHTGLRVKARQGNDATQTATLRL